MFSTIFYMLFNSSTGLLKYCSAGHPPAVLLSPNKPLRLLSTSGPMIGLQIDSTYEEREEVLNRGDKVILYTDGVIEYINADKEYYGSERFYQLLEKLKGESVEKIIKEICASLKEYGGGAPQKDDVSLLGIEYHGV